MKNKNKMNKIWKSRLPFLIFAVGICMLIGVLIYMKSKPVSPDIEFVYQGMPQTSAKMETLCNVTGWKSSDINLVVLDHGEDVSEQVQEVKVESALGMDITYTWKEESFILHVMDESYTPPIFKGPSEIKVSQGDTLAENFAAYDITVSDFCNKDISDKIEIDTIIDFDTIGSQKATLFVVDDFQHKSEYPVTFEIEEASGTEIEYNDGIANPLTITPEIIKKPEKLDVLVNKFHALPEGWTPNDLVDITSNNGRPMQLRQEAAAAFERMNAAALQDDITIRVISAYRTKDYQQSLFNKYYNDDPLYAFKYSAVPRRSEHETGLAIDVSYDGYLYTDLDTSDLGIWMQAHAHEYGFMLRFLSGKETITNYAFEPWHYRYVGSDIATKIKTSGVTMEEYYGSK